MTSVKKERMETAQAALEAAPLVRLQDMLSADMKAVNALILSNLQSEVPLIPQIGSYLIAAGGKRIRPLLTIAATALYKGDARRAHRLSAAVEFIHTATLLHDDVVDDSDRRRGQASANAVFGNEASVLVGDFLFSRAFQLMVQDGSLETLRILSDAAAVITQGEVLQLSIQNSLEITLDDYLKVIRGKTAALFAAACEVGPVVADADKPAAAALCEYGMALGMAFQISDDALDYNAKNARRGKSIGDDFREGKVTAPVLYALKNASAEEFAFWQRTMAEKNQTEGDLARAQAYIERHKGHEQSLILARNFAGKARLALAEAPDSPLRAILDDLAIFAAEREY